MSHTSLVYVETVSCIVAFLVVCWILSRIPHIEKLAGPAADVFRAIIVGWLAYTLWQFTMTFGGDFWIVITVFSACVSLYFLVHGIVEALMVYLVYFRHPEASATNLEDANGQ